uniref:IS481 family transposase n=1 Tax=Streptomyces atratus TaxID=1893 RepID=A0A411PQH5_STRAR|nr:IS481 family transposase [Streptomyces atratus]
MHRVPARFGPARLTHLDRATGRPIRRYERERPGQPVHVDIKKLGNIPDGGGHKALGPRAGRKPRSGARQEPVIGAALTGASRRSTERGAKAVQERCVPQWEAVRRALAHRDTPGWRRSCAESSGSSVGASNSQE